MRISRRFAIVLVASLGATASAVFASTVLGEPRAVYPSWAPGVSVPVTSMATLPPVVGAPALVASEVERAANAIGGDARYARGSLRLLRADVGTDRADVYGFSADGAGVCLLHWQRSLTCPVSKDPTHPGVTFIFDPGGPGYKGQPDDLPPAVVGIVADNVVAAAFTNNGKRQTLPIRNNTFFAEVARPSDGDPWEMALEISYADGSKSVSEIADPRA